MMPKMITPIHGTARLSSQCPRIEHSCLSEMQSNEVEVEVTVEHDHMIVTSHGLSTPNCLCQIASCGKNRSINVFTLGNRRSAQSLTEVNIAEALARLCVGQCTAGEVAELGTFLNKSYEGFVQERTNWELRKIV
jgi:hypothetical protein